MLENINYNNYFVIKSPMMHALPDELDTLQYLYIVTAILNNLIFYDIHKISKQCCLACLVFIDCVISTL